MTMTKYEKAAQTAVNKCLDLRKDESLLILATEAQMEIASYILTAASKKTKNTFLLQLPPFSQHTPLHSAISTFMRQVQAVVAITSPTILYTDAHRQACMAGTRIITMPSLTLNSFGRIADMNLERTSRLSKKLADILSMASEIHVTSINGTDLTIPVSTRRGYADTGIVQTPGAFSNLPAGEALIVPDEEKCEGQLIVDSGLGIIPSEQEPLTIQIKEGRAARISGGSTAVKLSRHLSALGPHSRVIAEFGMGTNDAAQLSGCIVEDAKILGTIHIGIGNNTLFGGRNDIPIHLDAVVCKATVEINSKLILSRGKLVID
ncbi:MAG: hypothetical protein EHM72_07560 [Calditrichaeota bacterium]|nr:MAG: hypothetical protein EHM72_07560 [Calditrichota bacterium]